jgi:hypothetical protein
MSKGYASGHFWLVLAVLTACGPATRDPKHPVNKTTRDAGASAGAPDAGATDDHGDPLDAEPDALGHSNATAIQVCKRAGQVAYLQRLRCAGDRAPAFERVRMSGYRTPRNGPDDFQRSLDQVRSAAPLADGETDFHPVDLYAVTCPDAGAAKRLRFDMYHCADGENTTVAPPGFELAPEAAEPPAPDEGTESAPE